MKITISQKKIYNIIGEKLALPFHANYTLLKISVKNTDKKNRDSL